jgi:hypothetical protein
MKTREHGYACNVKETMEEEEGEASKHNKTQSV